MFFGDVLKGRRCWWRCVVSVVCVIFVSGEYGDERGIDCLFFEVEFEALARYVSTVYIN